VAVCTVQCSPLLRMGVCSEHGMEEDNFVVPGIYKEKANPNHNPNRRLNKPKYRIRSLGYKALLCGAYESMEMFWTRT